MDQAPRKTNIRFLGDIKWGTHICQFYQTKEDLLDLLVPYFTAGLENNEFCMWVTSEPLSIEDAKAAMQKAVPGFQALLDKGQIEIMSYRDWYLKGGAFDMERVLQGWVEKLEAAKGMGYDGLRLTGNTFWLEKKDWKKFYDYEAEINKVIGRYRMLALCTYSTEKCSFDEILDVISNHQYAIIKRDGKWDRIESREHRKIMQELEDSEDRYRTLFTNMIESFAYHKIITDKNGEPCDYIFLEMNDAFQAMTGLKKEKILGRKVSEILPGIINDPAGWIKRYGHVALTGEPSSFEEYSEQIKKWYRVLAYCPKKGYFVTMFEDITNRKNAEAALEWNEQRNRILSESAALLLGTDEPQNAINSICSKTMKFLCCHVFFNYLADRKNGRLRLNAYTGITESEAERIRWLDYGTAICGYVAREGRRMVAEGIQRSEDTRVTLVRGFGIRAYCCHPLYVGNTVLGTISFGTRDRDSFTDAEISMMEATAGLVSMALERMHSQEKLQKAYDELQKVNNLKSTVLRDVSHEMKQPITVIKLASAVLAQELDKEEPDLGLLGNYVSAIKKTSGEFNEQLNAILELSRLDNTRHINKERIDVNEIVMEIVADKRNDAALKGLEIETSLEELPEASANPDMLSSLVRNLISNAIKYTDKGKITVKTGSIGNALSISVSDTGIGISDQDLGRLFEPFFRVDMHREGFGVGLAMCKKIAELHQGRISVDSEPGRGSTFLVELPAAEN